MHPDSVSRNLANRSGLASAVLRWGGSGKSMVLSRELVLRWWRASTCTRRSGRPCRECADVLEDAQAVGEHLRRAKHGFNDWGSCADDDACVPYGGPMCQPCRTGGGVAP